MMQTKCSTCPMPGECSFDGRVCAGWESQKALSTAALIQSGKAVFYQPRVVIGPYGREITRAAPTQKEIEDGDVHARGIGIHRNH